MKIRLIKLLIFFALILQVYHNAYSFPSVKRKIYFKNNTIDTLQFRKDLKYFNELNRSNYDSLLNEGYNLLDQSKALNFKWGLFISNFELSYAYLKLGNLDSALYYANNTMHIATKNQELEWIANSHKRLASCYEESNDYEKAIFHYIECEKIARANNFNELIIDVLNSKGILYRKMKNYKIALEHFNSILKEFPKSLSNIDRFRVANNIANVYYDQRLYDKAQESFLEAKIYAVSDNDSLQISLVNQNLGNIYFRQGKLDLAEKYMEEPLRYFDKTGDNVNLEIVLRTMGSIQTQKGNYAKAEKYFGESIKLAKQIRNIRSLSMSYHNLATNFYKWKKIDPDNWNLLEKENACMTLEINYKDTLYNIETAKKIHELEKKYETEKKNTQIAILEKETEIQQTRQMFMYIGMGILILIMGILAVSFQYVRKTNNTLLSKNKRIEAQNNQIQLQNKQLEVSINTQNKLFTIIAHDLRSPLASISNIAILLKMAFDDNNWELANEMIEKLGQRNVQVLQLTDNLLNWASSQTGKIQFTRKECSLNGILKESVSMYEEAMNQKGIHLKLDIPDDPTIYTDSLAIQTVFRNLINNAVKFTKKGGTVSISHTTEDEQVVVKISDTGIGIPQYIQNIIFEVTDKKQQTGTLGEKSSGLGLVVCKEFIERNGGRIWLSSVEGEGSDFYVSLPLFKDQ